MLRTWIVTVLWAAAIAGTAAARAEDPPAATHTPPAAETPHAAPAGHADTAAHEEHKTDIFSGNLGNMIWTTIVFLIVVYVLGRYAWRPLTTALNEREQQIRGALEQARAEREQAEKVLAQYRAQIDQARREATAIVEEGRRDAEETRRRLQATAQKEADETLARAKREIQLASDAAIKELYDRTAELAVQVASGVIRKTLSPEDHRGLVTESLERMKAPRN